MTKLLFLNETIDFSNWGAHACSAWLKEIIRDAMPDATFIDILSHWTTDRFYQLPWWLGNGVTTRRRRFIRRFIKQLSFLPVVTDDFERVANEWCDGKGGPFAREFLDNLSRADAVVFNAEGSTYNNNSSAIRCLFALWLAEKRFHKPAFFCNGSVTLTPVYPVLNAMVARTFQGISGAAVREPCSLENVQKWAPDIGVRMFPDSVFYAAGQKKKIENTATIEFIEGLRDKPYFCFSLSMLTSLIGGYKIDEIETTAFYDLIKSLQLLVPNAVLMAKDPVDQTIIRNLAEATGSTVFGPEHHYSALVPLYQNARFMISGRYHHLIMAAIAGCPPVALRTTSHKVDGLCRLMQPLMGETFDPTWLRPVIGKITERVRSVMDEGEDLRRRLRNRSLECRDLAAGIGEMIHQGISP